jgi:hypothetical protein
METKKDSEQEGARLELLGAQRTALRETQKYGYCRSEQKVTDLEPLRQGQA